MGADTLTLSPELMTLVWLGLFIILIIIEVFTVGLSTIWFALGALAAMAADLLGGGLVVQVIVFLAVSCVLLVATRPWALKYVNKNRVLTNYESELGKIILITEKVDNLKETGKSIVDGQEWTVRSKDDRDVLEAGEKAKVVDISGVKLIVEKYKEDSV